MIQRRCQRDAILESRDFVVVREDFKNFSLPFPSIVNFQDGNILLPE